MEFTKLKKRSMINLNIQYSIESEILRVQSTINKMDWFKKKGYKLKLPKGLSLNHSGIENPEYIKKIVTDEYSEEDYKKEEEYVLSNLSKLSISLEKFFTSVSIRPQDVYEINLTRYGVGGSYYFPNGVIINIQVRREMNLVKTIIHEIVHLSIQSFIDEYKIEHWVKERVVDLILEETNPEINTIQKVPIDTNLIDEAFKKYYPNIEEVIKNI